MREQPIEQHLRTLVEKHDGRAYKWVSPGNAGVPDRLVVLPPGHIFLVELKASKKGRLSAAQKVQREKLEDIGVHVVVLDSKEKVTQWVEAQSYALIAGRNEC